MQPRAVAYYRELLRDGIDGINLLGTTGEAMSFGARAAPAFDGGGRRERAARADDVRHRRELRWPMRSA